MNKRQYFLDISVFVLPNFGQLIMNFFNKIVGKVSELSEKLHSKSKLTQITSQIYHSEYPSYPNAYRDQLKTEIGTEINFQLLNLSQYEYPQETLKVFGSAHIDAMQNTYQFYTSMPLTLTITQIKRMKNYLSESQDNVVVVHCQETKSRSVLFLAAYLFLNQVQSDIASALENVTVKLGLNDNKALFATQHNVLRNLANFHKDPNCINKQHLKMQKIIINQSPKIPEINPTEPEEPLRVLLEIYRDGKLICKTIKQQFGQGEILHFDTHKDSIILADDCLIAFKYIHQNKLYPVARIQLNTNFIFNNFIRVQMQEMDIVSKAQLKGQVFTDFLFEAVKDTESELFRMGKKEVYADIESEYLKKESSKQMVRETTKITDKIEERTEKQAKITKEEKKEEIEREANDEDFGIGDEDDHQQSEEKLNQMLNELAMKKIEVEESIKEEEDDESEEKEDHTEKQEHKQDHEQQRKTEQIEKQGDGESNDNKQQEPSQKKQTKNNDDEKGENDAQHNSGSEEQEGQEEEDMDDYFAKLEKEAEQAS